MMNLSFKELLQQANKLASQKNISEAKSLYLTWLDRNSSVHNSEPKTKSELAVVHNNLGQLKYLQVDFEGAVEDYEKALEIDPELASAYYNRGTIWYRMGKFDKAIQDMMMAVHYAPGNEEFITGLERTKSQLLTSDNPSESS